MNKINKRLNFALLVDWFTGWEDMDCYEWGIQDGVAAFTKEKDINLFTFVTGRLDSPKGWEKNRNILYEFIDKNKIDGIITIPPCINAYGVKKEKSPVLERFKGIPTVVIGENVEGYSSVYVNNYAAMKKVMSHLIDVHNCKAIAYMKGLEGSKEMELRFKAYIDTLRERGIPFRPELLYCGDYTFHSGSKGMAKFVSDAVKFDGLVCSNDEMAVGAISEYYKTFRKPMDEICITGFDDSERGQLHNLTTVKQCFYEEGKAAAEVLFRMIQGESGLINEELPADIVIRSSCGCISEGKNDLRMDGVLFHNMPMKSKGISSYMTECQVADLEPLDEELSSVIDLREQMNLLYDNLPFVGIDSAYVTIYDNPDRPLENAKLILAYTDGKRHALSEEGLNYNTLELLPNEIWSKLQNKRMNLIIEALYHENQLGFIALNMDFKPRHIPERIRAKLSSSIRSALMVKNIKDQAEKLEGLVIERTKELSDINKQLMEEVDRRYEAEKQLKKALMELENYNKILHFQSIRDDLTGLYNRRGFIKLGNEQYEGSKKLSQSCLVFYADLDGLKQINDKYGHAEGDFAIIKTAEILAKCFRATDIVARIGGDEFTILVIGAAEEDKEIIWRRIADLCESYNKKAEKPYAISVSVGCTYFKSGLDFNLEKLLKDADHDLYNEKQCRKSHNNKSS